MARNSLGHGLEAQAASLEAVDDQSKGFHLRVDRYLMKPIEHTELIKELKSPTGQPPMMEALIIDDEERKGFARLANTSRTSYCWISGWRT